MMTQAGLAQRQPRDCRQSVSTPRKPLTCLARLCVSCSTLAYRVVNFTKK